MLKNTVTSDELLEIMKEMAVDGMVHIKSKASLTKKFNYDGANPTVFIAKRLKQLIKENKLEEIISDGISYYRILGNLTKIGANNISKDKLIEPVKEDIECEFNLRYMDSSIGKVIPVSDITKNINTVTHSVSNTINRNKDLPSYLIKLPVDSISPQKCLTIEGSLMLLNILSKKYNDIGAINLSNYLLTVQSSSQNDIIDSKFELDILPKEILSSEEEYNDIDENLDKAKSIQNINNSINSEENLINDSDTILTELFDSFGQLQDIVKDCETRISDYENKINNLTEKLSIEKAKYNKVINNVTNLKSLVDNEIKDKTNIC